MKWQRDLDCEHQTVSWLSCNYFNNNTLNYASRAWNSSQPLAIFQPISGFGRAKSDMLGQICCKHCASYIHCDPTHLFNDQAKSLVQEHDDQVPLQSYFDLGNVNCPVCQIQYTHGSKQSQLRFKL